MLSVHLKIPWTSDSKSTKETLARYHNERPDRSSLKPCAEKQKFEKLIKELGVKSYRLSLEWSKIEPTRGNYDEDVIQRYHDIIDTLISNDIVPVITLHHFTDPIWFHELGAFEKKVNNIAKQISSNVFEANPSMMNCNYYRQHP